MKKVKTFEWIPVNLKGEEWVYYGPGVRGSRNAVGYISICDDSDRWCDVFMEYDLALPRAKFQTIRDAADYLMTCAARNK